MHGNDLVHPKDVGSAEGETAFQIAAHGADQRLGDAIGGLFLLAGADTVEGALEGFFQPLTRGINEIIGQCAARHTHRAADDGHILLSGLKIALLEALVRVAFMGGHKARSHLDAGSAQIQEFFYVCAGIYAAGRDNRHRATKLVLKGFDRFHYLGHQDFQRVRGILNFLRLEAQMPASFGAFHHKGVRQVVEAGEPFFGDNRGGSAGGYNGNEFGFELFLLFLAELQKMARHVQRQSRAGKNDINLVFNGGAHHLRKRGQSHHDVDADDAGGELAGLDNLVAQGAQIRFQRIFGHVRLFHADHGSGNDADAALVGDSRRQAGQRYSHTHAALNDGHFGREIADFQRREGHCNKTSVLNRYGVRRRPPRPTFWRLSPIIWQLS